jgi:hypothetical protein
MTSECTVDTDVKLQEHLFTFLRGVHDVLEPYWYKTVEGGDSDVSSLPLLLGITDVAWQNLALAASIARIRRGQFEFKRNVFLKLLKDYRIDTETTMLQRKEWKPQMQLMIRIGAVRKNDSPLPSLKMHLQNPVKCPDLEHPHQEVQKRRRIIMMNTTVQDAMDQTAMETSLIDCHESKLVSIRARLNKK